MTTHRKSTNGGDDMTQYTIDVHDDGALVITLNGKPYYNGKVTAEMTLDVGHRTNVCDGGSNTGGLVGTVNVDVRVRGVSA